MTRRVLIYLLMGAWAAFILAAAADAVLYSACVYAKRQAENRAVWEKARAQRAEARTEACLQLCDLLREGEGEDE